MIDTGLRIGELVNLKMDDVHMDQGYLKVMGKDSKERIVPIGKYVQMTLWAYIDKVRPEPINTDCNNLEDCRYRRLVLLVPLRLN